MRASRVIGKQDEWSCKKPYLCNGAIRIQGKSCPVKKIAEGDFHFVYEFLDETKRILKIANPLRRPVRIENPLHPTKQVLDELKIAEKYNIPYPQCYIRPDTYVSSFPEEKGDGGFFVMEKIPHKVEITWTKKTEAELTQREKNILSLVIEILNLHIKENAEIVPDLYPKNVMVRDDETPVVVDMTHPNPEGTLKERIEEKIAVWGGSNPNIEQYIIQNLSKEWKHVEKETTDPDEGNTDTEYSLNIKKQRFE